MRCRRGIAVGFAVVLFVSALGPQLEADQMNGLDLEARIRYQGRMEKAYLEQRTAALNPSKTVSMEEPMSPSELREKVEKQLKMTDALEQIWGRRITTADLQAEYERILEQSNDQELLQRLLHALDRNPEAIAACLIEPIVIRRAIHRAYWWDRKFHDDLRRTVEDELLTDDDAGGLGWFTGELTQIEWRLVEEDQPRQVKFEDGVQIRMLDRQQWDRLLEDLGRRWAPYGAPVGDLPILRFNPLEEEKEYFWSSMILEKDTTHLRMVSYTWWKKTFSRWWEDNAHRFAVEAGAVDYSIDLHNFHAPNRSKAETEDRSVTGNAWYPLNSSDPDIPSPRDQHTVLWTGTGMIIWGGTNGTQYFNSGGIYDPATDSWTATSQGTGCPSARIGHTMTPASNWVYIWGGWNGATNYNTGSRYFPATNTWIAMAVDTATPIPRHGHAALGGGYLFIWGGRTGTSLTATGAHYNADLDAWGTSTPTEETPTARENFVTITNENQYYVWGGQDGTGYPGDGGRYDGGGFEWLSWSMTGAPSGRFGHTGVAAPTYSCGNPYNVMGRIIWGGYAPSDTPSFSNTGAVDLLGWSATPTGTGVPSGRMDHSAVMDATREWMIIWGGSTASGVTKTGGVFDLCDDTWSATGTSDADCPSARSLHTAVWTGKTMIVWGGSDGSSSLGDGGAFTHCWGTPTTSQIPVVGDEDPCASGGDRVSWNASTTWYDYDVHRRVAIVRDGVVIASDLLLSDLSYLDTTAVQDQSYDYQVRFIDSCGGSVTTTAVSGMDLASSAPSVTATPTAVDVDGCATNSGIDISWPADPDDWGDNGEGNRQYRVWRWRNGLEGWVALGSKIDYPTTTYHDPLPTAGSYRVKYINGCGLTADSPATEMVQDVAGSTPTVSQTVTAEDANVCTHSGNTMTWPADPDVWGDSGSGDRLYRVRRSVDGVNFNPLGDNIAYPATSYVDTSANPDRLYYYQVRYKNGCDLSADSGNDTATDIEGNTPVVTAVSISAADPDFCDDGGVDISWDQDAGDWGDNDSGTRTYDVLRDGSALAAGTGMAYSTTSFTDTTGDNGTTYLYKVRYNNGCGLAGTTTGDNGRDLPMAPDLPANNNTAVDLDACSGTGVLVTWDADPDGVWGDNGGTHTYEVLRGGVSLQSGIAYGTTEFTDTTGTVGTAYLYTVRYWNCGDLYVETAGVTVADNTAPAAPAQPTVRDASACYQSGVWITWTAVAGATGYDLRVDGSTEITDVTQSHWYDPGDMTEHTYEVRAKSAACTGAWSATTSFTDIIDPDAQFCDGFESGGDTNWSDTAP